MGGGAVANQESGNFLLELAQGSSGYAIAFFGTWKFEGLPPWEEKVPQVILEERSSVEGASRRAPARPGMMDGSAPIARRIATGLLGLQSQVIEVRRQVAALRRDG